MAEEIEILTGKDATDILQGPLETTQGPGMEDPTFGPEEEKSNNWIWWLIGGAALYFYLRIR